MVSNRTNRYRAAWISDVHLGTRGSNAVAFLTFLKENEFDTLYIVGDLIDIWSLRRGIYWPQEHNDVIQKLLRKARKGTRIVYIPGNHDEFLSSHLGAYGAITVQKHAIHLAADGRRILVLHGHELDTVVQNVRWLAFLGDENRTSKQRRPVSVHLESDGGIFPGRLAFNSASDFDSRNAL